MRFANCPPDCRARWSPDTMTGPARPAEPCPIREAQGRYGWPCYPSQAEVIATETAGAAPVKAAI